MYGGTALASSAHPHGLSAMDAAAAASNDSRGRGYFRPGIRGGEAGRPETSASSRTTPLNNKTSSSNMNKSNSGGVSSTGLIRLTLKKPMGIVFEPMEDPHNPSQQRGVRICDLPRTGSAAMSGQVEIGDELLSINNKTMSRLTFDEIMDFIIQADADSVNLLFRRPKKDSARFSTATETPKKGGNVKWVDTKDEKVVTEMIEPEPEPDQDTIGEESASLRSKSPPKKRGGKGKDSQKGSNRDEESLYSGDETLYTETTEYTAEEERKKKRRNRRGRNIESESFLDMLIDSLCAPVMGDSRKRGGGGDYSDDDETYNSADDATYNTFDDESYVDSKKKKWNERKQKEKERQKRRMEKGQNEEDDDDDDTKEENIQFDTNLNNSNSQSNTKSRSSSFEPVTLNIVDEEGRGGKSMENQQAPPPPPPPPPGAFGNKEPDFQSNQGPSMNMNNMNMNMNNMNMNSNNVNNMMNNMNLGMGGMGGDVMNMGVEPQNRFEPNLAPRKQEISEESLIADPNRPIAELEYDDHVDHAADVSVMDSIGGPSLLLENLRNASRIVKTVSTDVIAKFGTTYPQDLGLTREESIQVDPSKFYQWVVKNLLQTHEPEKVRLIDKLFEKYKGREEHLIHKLSARYADDADVKSKKSGELSKATESADDDYEGFKAFGGDFSRSEEDTKDEGTKTTFDNSGWPSTIGEEEEEEEENTTLNESVDDGMPSVDLSQSEDDYDSDYESIDGTSPEVIAQVSELLNYVYGKTSVPGQIDRVSTIMRAYEGRTAVLLELLETKALLKANADTENADEIPNSLRENPQLKSEDEKKEIQIKGDQNGDVMMSPISNLTGGSMAGRQSTPQSTAGRQSTPQSMAGRQSTPQSMAGRQSMPLSKAEQSISGQSIGQSVGQNSKMQFDQNSHTSPIPSYGSSSASAELSFEKKKKKKGLFGMFKKKKGKKDSGV